VPDGSPQGWRFLKSDRLHVHFFFGFLGNNSRGSPYCALLTIKVKKCTRPFTIQGKRTKTKLVNRGDPQEDLAPRLLIHSIKLQFHSGDEVVLPWLEWSASEDFFIPLFPNLSGCNDENSNKGLMMTISLCFLNCVKEVEIVIPLDSQEAPTFCSERALKYTFFGC
jgi:hypothetical protein